MNTLHRHVHNRTIVLFVYDLFQDKQSKAQRLPLMGYTVFLLGQQGKQDNVIKIDHHNLKPPLLLASDSAETSNKWVAVSKRSFCKASAELWNRLPLNVKNCQTVNLFKTSLKTHLFKIAFDD